MSNLYETEHRELSRIAKYQFQKWRVIVVFALIIAMTAGLFFYSPPGLAIAIGVFAFLRLIVLTYWVKHSLNCPSCKKPFYGRFRPFMPFTDRCQNCGFSLVPDDRTNG